MTSDITHKDLILYSDDSMFVSIPVRCFKHCWSCLLAWELARLWFCLNVNIWLWFICFYFCYFKFIPFSFCIIKCSVTFNEVLNCLLTGLSHGGGVLPDNLNVRVGETVTFTTTVTPPVTPFLVVAWSFSGRNIITSGDVNSTDAAYADRITLFRSTASLELRNLILSDSGEYSVTIIPNGEAAQRGNCRLVIHGTSIHQCKNVQGFAPLASAF